MKYKQLQKHASECQVAADEMAFCLLQQKEVFSLISVLQGHCDFNLYWLYQISPEIVLHTESIRFMVNHKDKFKRKLSIKEMINFDSIISHSEINSFEDFKNILKI